MFLNAVHLRSFMPKFCCNNRLKDVKQCLSLTPKTFIYTVDYQNRSRTGYIDSQKIWTVQFKCIVKMFSIVLHVVYQCKENTGYEFCCASNY